MRPLRRERLRPAARGLSLTSVLLAAALLATGCGDDASTTYAAQTAHRLQADSAAVRDAAEHHDVPRARDALAQLTRDVADAQAANHLPRRRARRILEAVDAVTADLAAMPTPTPTPSHPEGHAAKGGGHGTKGKHGAKGKHRAKKGNKRKHDKHGG